MREGDYPKEPKKVEEKEERLGEVANEVPK